MFDTFTDREFERMEVILAELKEVEWAQRLIQHLEKNGGLVGANMDSFFELRVGHSVHAAGASVRYEVPGEGDSSIDFGFASKGRSWKVELMRLRETQAAKDATITEIDEDGVTWVSQILSSANKDKKQSPEGETLKAIERICQKCESDGKPHKFPSPSQDGLHAILVDLRTFKRGGDVHDRLHIGLGGEHVHPAYRMYWGDADKRRLISGVFSENTLMKGAAEARTRVHFIGFVHEKTFQAGEICTAIDFVGNPYLFRGVTQVKEALATWPLQPARCINLQNFVPVRKIRVRAGVEADLTYAGMWRFRYPDGRLSDMVNLTRANDLAAIVAARASTAAAA